MNRNSSKTILRAFLPFVSLMLSLFTYAGGQEKRSQPPKDNKQVVKPEKDIIIRVGVDEIRIDAVVVDRKGRQITDLTSDDFEIYQDDQRQKIISSSYISDEAQPGMQVAPSQVISAKDSKTAPPATVQALKPSAVRRTIVFLVDDLNMTFWDIHRARLTVRKFLEKQMQPGDLVAIMPTRSGSANSFLTFSSDKRKLLDTAGTIKWSVSNVRTGLPQTAAISYCIRALQDMPGRKYLLLLSQNVILPQHDEFTAAAFNNLAEDALRAGVVVHTLDILGLIYGLEMDAEYNPYKMALVPKMTQKEEENFKDIGHIASTPNQEELAHLKIRERAYPIPLSEKTGGLYLTGNNFFTKGIGDVAEEIKGYYLLSYIPPADTFNFGRQEIYHRIKIKVKRPGSIVRTREGFFGVTDALRRLPSRDRTPLMDAMFSPFQNNELKMNLASGYINDAEKGYLLKAWLHLDGRNLGIINEKDGSYSVSLETVAATSDGYGRIQDTGNMQIKFPLNPETYQWMRENGIKVTLTLPAKKSGAYYVRAAVKDNASGAMGSAYQFVEIPDLQKDSLALSSIIILNREDDAAWIQSADAEQSQKPSAPSPQAAGRSQALRSYLPGESFEYMAVIYNAKSGDGRPPTLESQSVLFRNGEEIFRSKSELVDISGVKDIQRIPIRKKLQLDNTLKPGEYALQLLITDKRGKEKAEPAMQVLDFQIPGPEGKDPSRN